MFARRDVEESRGKETTKAEVRTYTPERVNKRIKEQYKEKTKKLNGVLMKIRGIG